MVMAVQKRRGQGEVVCASRRERVREFRATRRSLGRVCFRLSDNPSRRNNAASKRCGELRGARQAPNAIVDLRRSCRWLRIRSAQLFHLKAEWFGVFEKHLARDAALSCRAKRQISPDRAHASAISTL